MGARPDVKIHIDMMDLTKCLSLHNIHAIYFGLYSNHVLNDSMINTLVFSKRSNELMPEDHYKEMVLYHWLICKDSSGNDF